MVDYILDGDAANVPECVEQLDAGLENSALYTVKVHDGDDGKFRMKRCAIKL